MQRALYPKYCFLSFYRKYYHFIIVLGLSIFISNQSFANQSFDVKYLNTKHGLSNNHVTCVCEDSKGFIWFGTRDGLNRWDGYQFKVYRNIANDTNSLSDNFIRSIGSDGAGNIWIGSNQMGAIRFNIEEEKFYRYPVDYNNPEAFPSSYVLSIHVQNDSIIWFGTNTGLVKYLPHLDSFKRVYLLHENKDNHTPERVISIFKLNDNSIGIQSNIGLFKIEQELSSKIIIPESFAHLSTLHESNPIFYSNNKDIWFADPELLYHYNYKTKKTNRIKHDQKDNNTISSNDVSGIFQDSHDNIWIITWDAGANLFNKEENTFTIIMDDDKRQMKMSNNIVTSIFEDSYQNIWFTTEEGGISYINIKKNRIQFYEHDPFNKNSLINNKVGAFLSEPDGTMWIGTGNGGLNKFTPENNEFSNFLFQNQSTAPSILGIAHAHDNYFYLTGWGLGLFKFNAENGDIINIFANIPEINSTDKTLINIKGFTLDDKDLVWLATHSLNGINVYDIKKNVLYNAENPGYLNPEILHVPFPVSITQDSKKRIWVTAYSGLYMYDGAYHEYRASNNELNSISSNYVYSLFEDINGIIWIGTSNGLDRLETTENGIVIEQMKGDYQLPNNVKSIISDNRNRLWLASNNGITRFDPKTHQTKYFEFNRNVPVQEFIERSCAKSNTGELYFGTTNGFFRFHPDSIEDIKRKPNIYFTDFKIFNESQIAERIKSPLTKSIIVTDSVKLNYKQSLIGIEYVALDINSQNKIEYAYKMDGVDMQWNFSGSNRYTTYANLSPGEYTFRVRTADGLRTNKLNEAKLHIIITPPFWKTKLAYFIYIILSIIALYLFRRATLNREKLRSALRLEKIKIQNVQETNLMKLRFFTNISHEFRTPLTLIKVPIEKLLFKGDQLSGDERKYHYKHILNSAQKLDKMVTQLMDFRKMEAGSLVLEPSVGDIIEFCRKIYHNYNYLAQQKKINYTFQSKIESLFIAFDSDKLEKVLSNLLSNAFKNTPQKGKIKFSIEFEPQEEKEEENAKPELISIKVSDTGIGIPANELPHIFDRFYMVTGQKSETVKGTGIGLALARELTEIHQGNITVESIESIGTDFIVQLPVNLKPIEISNKKGNPLKEHSEESKHWQSDDLAGRKEYKILIVDDDDDMLQFLNHELEINYHITTAKNGQDGIDQATETKPDLIISDVMMPLVNGIELCQTLKRKAETSHIPIILLTARYSQEKEIEGLESGANAYIMKPFNLNVLHLTISNILDNRKNLIEKFKNDSSLFFENNDLESSDQKLIQEIINLVLDNITNNLMNADFISKRLHISRTVLYLKIEALTGQTVNEFINNIRLKKAKQLLLGHDVNITEVSFAVGFTSQSYFSRTFSRQFGYSPKEYIKRKKE
jgi:signal transduction histidine kinase/DNA-binding response OmpR family regulator/ligand-binding sensor domain-containing protein